MIHILNIDNCSQALKVMKGVSSTLESELNGSLIQAKSHGMELPSSSLDSGQADSTLINGTLEDFFLSFNPFMGLPMQPDDLSASIDLGLSPGEPLVVDDHGSP